MLKRKRFIVSIILLTFLLLLSNNVKAEEVDTSTFDTVDLEVGVLLKNTRVSDQTVVADGKKVIILDELENDYEIFFDDEIYYVPKENLMIVEVETYDEDNKLLSRKKIDNRGYLTKNIKLKLSEEDNERILKGTDVVIKSYGYEKFKVLHENILFSISKDYITFDLDEIEAENITNVERKERQVRDNEEDNKPSFSNDEILGLRIIQKQLVENATKRLGTPYLWGGTSDRYGFDCSGFTQKVYEEVGIKIPKYSGDQAKVGTLIKPGEQLKIGDLLFFGPDKIDHVGMYIGDDQFIHSSMSRKGVVTESIYSDYVKKEFSHTMRILD